VSDLPALPTLDPDRVAAWHEAHRRFAEFEAEVSAPVLTTVRRLLRRLLIEALANVQPVLVDPDHPLLFPPPRRFLTPELEQRVDGARAAFGYLDVAAAMHRMKGGPPVVTGCTPQVLNALLSGPVTERETNPGLLRMTPTHWMPDANPFEHADPAELPALLEGAVDVAANAPVPAVSRAGWLAFVMMPAHPFVDGNGRTARALFVGVSGSETGVGVDWGVLEQWGLAREAYVGALQAGQGAERYAGADIDPVPFMTFGSDTSTRGALVNTTRLEMLGEAESALGADLDDPDDIGLLLWLLIDRFVALEALLAGSPEPAQAMERVRALLDDGHVELCDPPTGGPSSDTSGRNLVIGGRWPDLAGHLRHARFPTPRSRQ
jgi:hypothetical protein